MPALRGPSRQQIAAAAAESVLSVCVATLAVAALDPIAPIAGLGVIYLLAVLFVAARHGELPALGTAVLSVLTLNFFFIEPKHQLTISDSQNVAALAVFLIAAVVVGRLAAASRRRAVAAQSREREAVMLAQAASSVLATHDIDAQLTRIAEAVAASTADEVRLGLSAAPSPRPDETSVGLPLSGRRGWLYAREDSQSWSRGDLARIAEPLARLIDVALEHGRVGEQAAEAEATRRADVAKTAILHAISHDLRSPLTAITTAASALRAGRLSDHDREGLVNAIEDESERLRRLIDDLLDISQIEAGATNPRRDWCDLQDVVASACAQARARTAHHPVEIALPEDLPLVQVDATQVERVFSNLIENAIKFSPPGKAVRVSGGAGGGRVTVRVTDRGRGIPASQQAHVFEPFFQGERGGSGSGLGLAICRGFVEANGGRILLQTGSDRGTAFAVSFPLERQPVAAG